MESGPPAIRAFGAVEVVCARTGAHVPVRSRLHHSLLAMLLAHRDRVVPTTALAGALWPAATPPSATKTLQIHVHRVRRRLGQLGTIRYCPPGYRLQVPADHVDLYRFEQLAQRGQVAHEGGDHATASAHLRSALQLYRGMAFAGLDHPAELAAEARRLAELRLVVAERCIRAELALGAHATLVAELESLVAESPLRERFRAQLMTALYRCGRKADALAVYREGRRILIEELGVEPGAECRALERSILLDDPALAAPPPATDGGSSRPTRVRTSLAPRQLPAGVAAFTGREPQLRWLDGMLAGTPAGPPANMVISVIDGPAGAGKTALAVHWSHRVRDRFPDGQLYVNLRGFSDDPPLRTIEALSRLLRTLGTDPAAIPADEEEAATLLRSRLAGTRTLVLLDNAASADQVRPLLPGDSGCRAVVTSRHRLTGLVARDGARRLTLGGLAPAEAVRLLAELLGDTVVAAEPAAAGELAELCGRLPLALRVAAAAISQLATTSGAGLGARVGAWAARIRGRDPLPALAVPGDPAATVTATFDLSYQRLPSAAQRLFRLAGLAPGPDLSVPAAAALADVCADEAASLLATLAEAHLLEEPVAGRFTAHDLLRHYAAHRAQRDEPEPGRRDALVRLFGFYLHAADAATELTRPGMLRIPRRADAAPGPGLTFSDAASALAWLEAERPNLTAAVARAAATGQHALAWQLADPVRTFLAHGGYAAEALAVAEVAVAAAATEANTGGGSPEVPAGTLLGLANVHFQLGRADEVLSNASRAEVVLRSCDWPAGEGTARYLLGAVGVNNGQMTEAEEHFLAAQGSFHKAGWQHGRAAVVSNLSVLYYTRGQLALAAQYARQAEQVFADLGSDLSRAAALVDLGSIHHVWGEYELALDYYTRARQCARAAGASDEADAVLGLAGVHRDAGRFPLAAQLAEEALTTSETAAATRLVIESRTMLAEIHYRLGECAGAVAGFQRAVGEARHAGDPVLEANALIGLAGMAPAPDGCDAAREHAKNALAIARETSYRILEGQALTRLAKVELADGRATDAIARGQQALACHRSIGFRFEQACTHLLLGHAHHAEGDAAAAHHQFERAERLFSAVGAAAALGDTWPPLSPATA